MARKRGKLRAKSQAQAHLFGMIAGGARPRKARGLSRAKAKSATRGLKVKRLPARVRTRKR